MASLTSWLNNTPVEFGSSVTPDSGHVVEALLRGWIPIRWEIGQDYVNEGALPFYELRMTESAAGGAFVSIAGSKRTSEPAPSEFTFAVIKSLVLGINDRHNNLIKLLSEQKTELEAKLKVTEEALAQSVAALDELNKKLTDIAGRVTKLEE